MNSYNQKILAQYYKLHVSLMDVWIKTYGDSIFVLDNEELVNNQEKISKQLVDFCDLEWEDQCLEFHKSKRQVRTASIEQVRQPINKRSIGAWKKYEKYFSDLVSELKEMISKNLNLSSQSNIIISNSRHLEALNNSLKAIDCVKSGLKDGLSGDLLSIDLNDAIINMSIITGKIDIDQDILGSIFSKFCIGK